MKAVKEPRKESAAIRRLREKAGEDEHFENLVRDVRKAMVMHLASPAALRQAATLVAYEHTVAFYTAQQHQPDAALDEKMKRAIDRMYKEAEEQARKTFADAENVLEDDDEEEGDEGAFGW